MSNIYSHYEQNYFYFGDVGIVDFAFLMPAFHLRVLNNSVELGIWL